MMNDGPEDVVDDGDFGGGVRTPFHQEVAPKIHVMRCLSLANIRDAVSRTKCLSEIYLKDGSGMQEPIPLRHRLIGHGGQSIDDIKRGIVELMNSKDPVAEITEAADGTKTFQSTKLYVFAGILDTDNLKERTKKEPNGIGNVPVERRVKDTKNRIRFIQKADLSGGFSLSQKQMPEKGTVAIGKISLKVKKDGSVVVVGMLNVHLQGQYSIEQKDSLPCNKVYEMLAPQPVAPEKTCETPSDNPNLRP